MYVAYMDDSGTDSKSPIAVVGGIVIPETVSWSIEFRVGSIVEALFPPSLPFEEFHAADLFMGNGVFDRISEPDRHEAIRQLIQIVADHKLPFIYVAVDKTALRVSPFGSTSPTDLAFRMCALGIDKWLLGLTPDVKPNSPSNLCGLVMDDTDDKALKQRLRQSFRALRVRVRGMATTDWKGNRLWRLHDDLYFGDSKYSVGIQIADLCTYFMMRKLRGEDDGAFFEVLRPHAIAADAEPEFSQCKAWLRLLK